MDYGPDPLTIPWVEALAAGPWSMGARLDGDHFFSAFIETGGPG